MKEYKWCSYLGHGSFAHAHLFKKEEMYTKSYSARLVTMIEQINHLHDIGITSPSKIRKMSLLKHRREDHENNNYTVVKHKKIESSIEQIMYHQNDALKEIKILQESQHENLFVHEIAWYH